MINIPLNLHTKEDRFCKKVSVILMACRNNDNLQMDAIQISQDILIAAKFLQDNNEEQSQKKLDETLKFIKGI